MHWALPRQGRCGGKTEGKKNPDPGHLEPSGNPEDRMLLGSLEGLWGDGKTPG